MFILLVLNKGLCFESKDFIKLKKADISDRTIQLLIREKTVETCAFTVQEIIDLKKSGLSEETIQLFIKENSFMKDAKPIICSNQNSRVEIKTPEDIIRLKDAGISDEVIKTIIKYLSQETDNTEEKDREQAWKMLENMGIIIDKREK